MLMYSSRVDFAGEDGGRAWHGYTTYGFNLAGRAGAYGFLPEKLSFTDELLAGRGAPMPGMIVDVEFNSRGRIVELKKFCFDSSVKPEDFGSYVFGVYIAKDGKLLDMMKSNAWYDVDQGRLK